MTVLIGILAVAGLACAVKAIVVVVKVLRMPSGTYPESLNRLEVVLGALMWALAGSAFGQVLVMVVKLGRWNG